MKCSEDEHNLLVTNIDLEAENFCSIAEICKGSECTHCYVIRSSDVLSAIGKLKTDKVNDNGLLYSNNFTTWYRVLLLFQYLRIFYTSMVYHGLCPLSFICANIIPIPKGSNVNLSESDKYRSIAVSSRGGFRMVGALRQTTWWGPLCRSA